MDARAEPTKKPGARCMVRLVGLVGLRQFWRAVTIAAFAGISLAPADISAHAQTRDDQPPVRLILAPAVDWPNKRRPQHLPTGRRARLSSAHARDWQLTIFTVGQRCPLTNQQSELFSKLRSIISTLAPA